MLSAELALSLRWTEHPQASHLYPVVTKILSEYANKTYYFFISVLNYNRVFGASTAGLSATRVSCPDLHCSTFLQSSGPKAVSAPAEESSISKGQC